MAAKGMEMGEKAIIPVERIERSIYLIRGQKVMLDRDLSELYGVETKALKQAVRRNAGRFPGDFAFVLDREEVATLRSQTVTSKTGDPRGGNRYAPIAFTEQGVAMLSCVLKSQQYDEQFRVVFEVLDELMSPPEPKRKQIGFGVREERATYTVKQRRAKP